MYIDFVRFGCTLLVTTEWAAVLSVCIGVRGWQCPISLRLCRAGTASRALTYMALISDSATDDMIVFMICARLSTAPLLGGKEKSLDMKKCPPARLLALAS